MIYIPNAFIQTLVNNKNAMTVIKIRGVLVDLLLKIDSEFYGPFVTSYKKGDKLRIVKFLDAIYWTMVASLLYYKKFVKILNKNWLQLNLYNLCAANRIVNDKKQTICFQVDDCKLIHRDSKVNDKFIKTLRNLKTDPEKWNWDEDIYTSTLAWIWTTEWRAT